MNTIKAIYDGTNFRTMQPIPVKENYEVFITFVEPLKKESALINESEKLPRSGALGLWQGKVWMADDFNAPLEELKEYMNSGYNT